MNCNYIAYLHIYIYRANENLNKYTECTLLLCLHVYTQASLYGHIYIYYICAYTQTCRPTFYRVTSTRFQSSRPQTV